MQTTKPSRPQDRLTIKLPEPYRDRIDAYAKASASPGLKASLASVVLAALDEFLEKRGV